MSLPSLIANVNIHLHPLTSSSFNLFPFAFLIMFICLAFLNCFILFTLLIVPKSDPFTSLISHSFNYLYSSIHHWIFCTYGIVFTTQVSYFPHVNSAISPLSCTIPSFKVVLISQRYIFYLYSKVTVISSYVFSRSTRLSASEAQVQAGSIWNGHCYCGVLASGDCFNILHYNNSGNLRLVCRNSSRRHVADSNEGDWPLR